MDHRMTMIAALSEGQVSGLTASFAAQGRIAHVEIFRDISAAEAVWRELEQPNQFSTPYQRFDLLGAWQDHVGASEGLEPFIVVAIDAERRPLALLPLGIERRFGLRMARFLGGKHTSFNMPLYRHDAVRSPQAIDIAVLIDRLRIRSDRPDVLALCQQPLRWHDDANPIAQIAHQPSVNQCPVLILEPGAPPSARISNSFRRRLKGKERKLQALPGYRYGIASTDAEITALLDAFFRVKPVRMAAQGLPYVFADPGVERFIREACLKPSPGGGRAIAIHALSCDDEMIAMYAGVADGSRYSMMFNTYTLSESARYSPGLILMRHIVDHYAEQGYRRIDLGIGSDEYKKLFCKNLEPIVDSFFGLTPRGRLAAAAMASIGRAKRTVKQSPALMRLAQRTRSVLHRPGPESPSESD
jgi:CelD/BcsL family acetyltransferase involved in cellulose biosynthesis